MKIKVNIDFITPSLEDSLREELVSLDLPDCLGSCYSPVINRYIEVEETSILELTKAIPEEEVVIKDLEQLKSIIFTSETILVGKSLTKEGLSLLAIKKKSLVKDAAQKLKKCIDCKYFDMCFKLTTNFLELLKINISSQ